MQHWAMTSGQKYVCRATNFLFRHRILTWKSSPSVTFAPPGSISPPLAFIKTCFLHLEPSAAWVSPAWKPDSLAWALLKYTQSWMSFLGPFVSLVNEAGGLSAALELGGQFPQSQWCCIVGWARRGRAEPLAGSHRVRLGNNCIVDLSENRAPRCIGCEQPQKSFSKKLNFYFTNFRKNNFPKILKKIKNQKMFFFSIRKIFDFFENVRWHFKKKCWFQKIRRSIFFLT